MATNFLQYAGGTGGFLTSPTTLMSTELNALASGSAATSSVAGPFTQATLGSGIFGAVYFTAGGASTPTAGGFLAGWFLQSTDAGTTFEALLATPSTTVPALARAPDFTIPAYNNAALANGSILWAQGQIIRLPFTSYKLVIQNLTGAALSASGHTIKAGSIAVSY